MMICQISVPKLAIIIPVPVKAIPINVTVLILILFIIGPTRRPELLVMTILIDITSVRPVAWPCDKVFRYSPKISP